MAQGDSSKFWSTLNMGQELSEQEKYVRDRFAEEYMFDEDAYAACIRIGFLSTFAKEYAKRFLNETYVLNKLRELSEAKEKDESEAKKDDERTVLITLRQAMKNGPYASRVAAAAKLASILGLDAPIKSQNELIHKGGVMMVPVIADINEWQKAAQESQVKLVTETRQ